MEIDVLGWSEESRWNQGQVNFGISCFLCRHSQENTPGLSLIIKVYFFLLRNIRKVEKITPLYEFLNKKMGILRKFLKEK
jgi:hypothetical protein